MPNLQWVCKAWGWWSKPQCFPFLAVDSPRGSRNVEQQPCDDPKNKPSALDWVIATMAQFHDCGDNDSVSISLQISGQYQFTSWWPRKFWIILQYHHGSRMWGVTRIIMDCYGSLSIYILVSRIILQYHRGSWTTVLDKMGNNHKAFRTNDVVRLSVPPPATHQWYQRPMWAGSGLYGRFATVWLHSSWTYFTSF